MTATIHKLHRYGAPDTSIDASDSIDTTALEQIVLSVIRRHPDGIISDEVRDICAEDYGITRVPFSLSENGQGLPAASNE